MSFLKNIPIRYIGELHNVKLINFSVDTDEVKNLVPEGIRVLDVNGRALISLVDVQLKNMHPSFVPEQLSFQYRHVAFRLLVDDSSLNRGKTKGIYFLRSFTDKPLIVQGGKWLTDYNLETAKLESFENMLELKQKDKFLDYAFKDRAPQEKDEALKQRIGSIDRAYAMNGRTMQYVKILREKWPIEWIDCYHFQTNFFKTARLEGAFKVAETIYYEWLPPQHVTRQLLKT